ncbi:MAG: T9SS type A sorting domain-containing protein [Ignavibacteria bacterium]|nr:T9SS type A sorting domain-containing protein [Ignavibacteria bacterium]
MKKFITIILLLLSVCVNAQWVQMSNGMQPGNSGFDFDVMGTNIFAMTSHGVYLSTDNGANWTMKYNSLPYLGIKAFAVSGNKIFAGQDSVGVYVSTNSGDNWTAANNGLTDLFVYSFLVSGNKIFAGTKSGRVFLSTNDGGNWTSVSSGLPTDYLFSLAVSGSNIFAGYFESGIFLSTNYGTNWTAINNGLTGLDISCIAVMGERIYASVYEKGIFLTTNNGGDWNKIGNGLPSGNIYVNTLEVYGTNIYAGVNNWSNNNSAFYVSTDYGANWISKSQGLPDSATVNGIKIANDYIFAGLTGSSVWRRNLSEVLGIQNGITTEPSGYYLNQNYPNPFNPSTKIEFKVLHSGNVKITVYDIMGREVQTIVNERLQPGTYETIFNGSGLNSGIYFYKMTAGGFTEVKRMVLLK